MRLILILTDLTSTHASHYQIIKIAKLLLSYCSAFLQTSPRNPIPPHGPLFLAPMGRVPVDCGTPLNFIQPNLTKKKYISD